MGLSMKSAQRVATSMLRPKCLLRQHTNCQADEVRVQLPLAVVNSNLVQATDISGYISASMPQSLSTISADEHLRLNEALAERLLELAAQRNQIAQANKQSSVLATLLASSQILADYMSRAKGSLETELASVRDHLQEAEEAQGRLNSRLLSQGQQHHDTITGLRNTIAQLQNTAAVSAAAQDRARRELARLEEVHARHEEVWGRQMSELQAQLEVERRATQMEGQRTRTAMAQLDEERRATEVEEQRKEAAMAQLQAESQATQLEVKNREELEAAMDKLQEQSEATRLELERTKALNTATEQRTCGTIQKLETTVTHLQLTISGLHTVICDKDAASTCALSRHREEMASLKSVHDTAAQSWQQQMSQLQAQLQEQSKVTRLELERTQELERAAADDAECKALSHALVQNVMAKVVSRAVKNQAALKASFLAWRQELELRRQAQETSTLQLQQASQRRQLSTSITAWRCSVINTKTLVLRLANVQQQQQHTMLAVCFHSLQQNVQTAQVSTAKAHCHFKHKLSGKAFGAWRCATEKNKMLKQQVTTFMQDRQAKHLSAVVSGWQNTAAQQQAVRTTGISYITAKAKQRLIRGAFLAWHHESSEAAMTCRAMIHRNTLKRLWSLWRSAIAAGHAAMDSSIRQRHYCLITTAMASWRQLATEAANTKRTMAAAKQPAHKGLSHPGAPVLKVPAGSLTPHSHTRTQDSAKSEHTRAAVKQPANKGPSDPVCVHKVPAKRMVTHSDTRTQAVTATNAPSPPIRILTRPQPAKANTEHSLRAAEVIVEESKAREQWLRETQPLKDMVKGLRRQIRARVREIFRLEGDLQDPLIKRLLVSSRKAVSRECVQAGCSLSAADDFIQLLTDGKSSQAHARAAIAHAAATAAALPTAVAADPPMATARPFTAAALPTPMVDATATFPTTRIAAPKRQVKDVAVTSLPGPMTSLRDGRSHGHHLSASVQQAAQLQPTAAPSHAPWPVMNAGQNGMTRPAHVPVIPGVSKWSTVVRKGKQSAQQQQADQQLITALQGKVGLSQGRNTCYQNSVFQALFMVPSFVDHLTHLISCEGDYSAVVTSLGQLFKTMKSSPPAQVVSTQRWYAALQGMRSRAEERGMQVCQLEGEQWTNGCQQDAHEFLTALLDYLQDALNTVSGQAAAQAQSRISNTEAKEIARLSAPEQAKLLWRVQSAVEHSVVDDAFAGQQQSTAQCCACKHDRLRFEKVIALELGLPGTSDPQQGCTLKECLDMHFKTEVLEEPGECEGACNGQKQTTKRSLGMSCLPRTLTIMLKRYETVQKLEYDSLTRKQVPKVHLVKDHRPILCPAVLDMAAYASSGTFGMAPSLYDAVAFVRHQGQSPTCGHYTTITKHDGGSAWVEHSDAELNLCQQPFAASSQSLIAIYQRR